MYKRQEFGVGLTRKGNYGEIWVRAGGGGCGGGGGGENTDEARLSACLVFHGPSFAQAFFGVSLL